MEPGAPATRRFTEGSPGRSRPPYVLVLGGTFLILVLTVVVAAATGSVAIPLWDALTTLLATWGLPVSSSAGPTHESILTQFRFPRIAVAAATGAALGLAGTLLAGAFRNPLAEPATVGTAAGALLGTSLAILIVPLWFPTLFQAATPSFIEHLLRILIAATLGLGATLLVLVTARTGGVILAGPLLLAGLAINAMIGAFAALILFIAPIGSVTAAGLVVHWIFGGLLAETGSGYVMPVVVGILLALMITVPLLRPLDILLAGEEEAAASGVHVPQTRLFALVAASIATGAGVALTGVIAFIGLVAPTLLRGMTGANHARLIPAAMLLGAALLVAADAFGRRISAPGEIPVGVITALIGAPVLLILLMRTLREVAQ